MRHVFALLAGLLLGAALSSTVFNVVARRHAWPRGIMHVMERALGEADAAVDGGRCSAAAGERNRDRLLLMSADVERALLPEGSRDRVLSQYAAELQRAVEAWDPDADCADQTAALSRINHACDDCHRDYR